LQGKVAALIRRGGLSVY